VRAQVLQVTGQDGVASAPLAAAVGARAVVIGAGADTFGRPTPPALDGAAAGTHLFRTEGHGDVTVTFERGRLTVASGHG
jgi:beta-lactamase superfamily II metal-dependent hydrolase